MQSSSPNPTALFVSWGRGAQPSAPPAQDAFREAFQSRLQARLAPRESLAKPAACQASRPGPTQSRQGTKSLPVAADSAEPRRVSAATAKKPPGAARQAHKKRETEPDAARLEAGPDQSTPQAAAAKKPPQALEILIDFLQSQPEGSLTIPQEQAPAVASFLRAAGLPQEEVDGLLSGSGSGEITLTAAELTASWERVQGQGNALETVQGAVSALELSSQRQKTQEIQQTADYRAQWQRLTLPKDMLPNLRLALARLGASPEILAQVEDEAKGQGIPLARIWQMLPKVTPGSSLEENGANREASSGAPVSPADLLGERPVGQAELDEWRQMLLKTGLEPKVVDKLLGQGAPANQEELKTTLLSMTPGEEPPPALTEPKPLYLPQALRLRPYFWQDHTGGDQPHLDEGGQEGNGYQANAEASGLPTPGFLEGNLGLPAFQAELQGLSQPLASSGPLAAAAPAWRLLSPEVRESLWTQLQSGVTTNLGQGENRVTLNLNPPELGQIQLTLHLSGQEVAVTALATRPEVAEIATQGVQQLLQALAQQGLVLTQFQVRLQDQPERLMPPALTGVRGKGNETGGNLSTSTRRRSREVDRFV
ncbi:MAG: flagellar hook-length control protein FliK [Desulfobaccales bacterium]